MAVKIRQKSRDEEWNRNMGAARQQQDNNMLAMALKMNDQQAIGYLIGALGKKLWMDHLARRHAREDATNLQNQEIANGQISNVDAFRKANGYPSEPTLNVPQDWNKPTAEATLTREELIPIVQDGNLVQKEPVYNVPKEFMDTTNVTNAYIDPNNNYELQYLRQRGLF